MTCSAEKIIIPDGPEMDNGYTEYKFHGVVNLSTDIVLFGKNKTYTENKEISENEAIDAINEVFELTGLNIYEIKFYDKVRIKCSMNKTFVKGLYERRR